MTFKSAHSKPQNSLLKICQSRQSSGFSFLWLGILLALSSQVQPAKPWFPLHKAKIAPSRRQHPTNDTFSFLVGNFASRLSFIWKSKIERCFGLPVSPVIQKCSFLSFPGVAPTIVNFPLSCPLKTPIQTSMAVGRLKLRISILSSSSKPPYSFRTREKIVQFFSSAPFHPYQTHFIPIGIRV